MGRMPMQSAIEARQNTPATVQHVAFIRTSGQMPLCGRTRASRGDKAARGGTKGLNEWRGREGPVRC
jgi:hypothetical protein